MYYRMQHHIQDKDNTTQKRLALVKLQGNKWNYRGRLCHDDKKRHDTLFGKRSIGLYC